MKIRITYIISCIDKALAFEWLASELNTEFFTIHFILLNHSDSALERYLKQNNIPVDRIRYRGKKDIPAALFKTYAIIKKNKSTVIHTHLFDANVVGLTAGWVAGIKKRIYTRHHSTYHHDYFPSAVKYDKFCNWLATDIVAVTENVRNVLVNAENVSHSKIHLVHHGFKFDEIDSVSEERIKSINNKYNGSNKFPVVGVISRYTHWKGVQFIIPAFKKLLEEYPNALLILANAKGDYRKEIRSLLTEIPAINYIEILFEEDLFSLYKLFDVFVHTPVNNHAEAFGQVYVEALASEIPSVFTLSGIANEFIKNKTNAIVADYQNITDIYRGILELLQDKPLATAIKNQGKKDANALFNIKSMISKLEILYLNN